MIEIDHWSSLLSSAYIISFASSVSFHDNIKIAPSKTKNKRFPFQVIFSFLYLLSIFISTLFFIIPNCLIRFRSILKSRFWYARDKPTFRRTLLFYNKYNVDGFQRNSILSFLISKYFVTNRIWRNFMLILSVI